MDVEALLRWYETMSVLLAAVLVAANVSNAIVLSPVANMYSRASEDASVASQAIYGSNVQVLEQQSGWVRVRTPDDYTGWVADTELRVGPFYAASGSVAEVSSLFANVYREPNVKPRRPLLTVPFETRLEVTGELSRDGHWMQVRLPDDRKAWVHRGNLAFAPAQLSLAEMLAFSRRFLGLPYTWGGTSTFGYDCSGFIQMLQRRRGIRMPRDARPQAEWSGVVQVSRAELQPGDLVYFRETGPQITHTGLYLGDGKFISATTWNTPMVRIDDIADPHWSELLVGCRRIK